MNFLPITFSEGKALGRRLIFYIFYLTKKSTSFHAWTRWSQSLILAHLRSSSLEKHGQPFRAEHPYPPRCSRAFHVLTACIASSRRDQSISHFLVPTPNYPVRVTRFESCGPSESPGRSPRIRHRHALTEKAWENAVQWRGNVSHRRPGSQFLRFSF